jgi:hypothetical protein
VLSRDPKRVKPFLQYSEFFDESYFSHKFGWLVTRTENKDLLTSSNAAAVDTRKGQENILIRIRFRLVYRLFGDDQTNASTLIRRAFLELFLS